MDDEINQFQSDESKCKQLRHMVKFFSRDIQFKYLFGAPFSPGPVNYLCITITCQMKAQINDMSLAGSRQQIGISIECPL